MVLAEMRSEPEKRTEVWGGMGTQKGRWLISDVKKAGTFIKFKLNEGMKGKVKRDFFLPDLKIECS